MGSNIASLCEPFPAYFTSVWSFTSMSSFVRLQDKFSKRDHDGKEEWICVGCLPSGFQVVRSSSHSQVPCKATKMLIKEPPQINPRTYIRLHTSMCTFMDFKVSLLIETFPAVLELAFVTFLVAFAVGKSGKNTRY
jgi:hypothetical protein